MIIPAGIALTIATVLPLPSIAHSAEAAGQTAGSTIAFAETQLANAADRLSSSAYPVRTGTDGLWVTGGADNWTSGFFPGALWKMYERTKDPAWKLRAEKWQAGIETQKTVTTTHDIGFQIFNSFGQDFQLTGDPAAKQVVLTAAGSLAKRYNPTVGSFRSWGAISDTSNYEVIADNMMNIEMMFWSAANGGDPAWRTMATQHTLNTVRDHLRSDGGSWHVVNYDQQTGNVISKYTHQGYSDSSTWSRGQAWLIYGFSMAYRYTQDTRFLEAARTAADYYVRNLPADKVPYWDFDVASLTGQPRDSSAAAVAAAGLVELAGFETDTGRALGYRNVARDTIASLSSPAYLAKGTPNQAILLHGTQNKPANSYDTGLIFGDYYFIEALQRYERATAGAKPAGRVTTRWI